MIARLRLMLADITTKETQLEGLRHQYREQRKRVVGHALYSETSLETSLGLLDDIAERLRAAETRLEHLRMIRHKAETELESLQLTRGVERAKAELARLQQQRAESGDASAEVAEEMRRLQTLINEASEQAARSIERR
jgi:hypothetical protein